MVLTYLHFRILKFPQERLRFAKRLAKMLGPGGFEATLLSEKFSGL
jgi:hypothetical protein